MRRLRQTPVFRGSQGEILPGSIAEVSYVALGGLDQWVMIRGTSVANPALILLHGGPGFSETALFRYFNAPIESSFTVVYWDQRGAGKSYDSAIPSSSMTSEQLLRDLDELVNYVCGRLEKTNVALLGHSWGSALGPLYAARHPQKVAAYVGCGQIGDWPAAESASYRWAVEEAERRKKKRALRQLRAIGPPPYEADAVFTERALSLRLAGGMRPRAMWKMGRALLGSRESSIFEIAQGWRSFHFTMNAMWPEVSRLNLINSVPLLQMPVFFLLGCKDPWVRPETSVAYFDALSAPAKRLVWFKDSGHEPFVDEPETFNDTVVTLVRPLLGSGNVTPEQ